MKSQSGRAYTNPDELMQMLSVPRINGSQALKETRKRLSDWLDSREIPHSVHVFRLHPHFMEIGGIWLLLSQLLLAIGVWLRWGWPVLLIAVLSLLVVVIEAAGTPLLSRLTAVSGENIIIEFSPSGSVEREIILTAHYDSKTELLNDAQRTFFMSKLPIAMVLALLLGIIGTLDGIVRNSAESWAIPVYYVGVLLTLPQLGLFVPIGINLIFGRFAPPSQGAVDNGAGCAILLNVAEQLARQAPNLDRSKVTIALFCGEEVVVQGSRAYVASRDFPYPTVAVNLELMGQDGDYSVWTTIGSSFQSFPSDDGLNELLAAIIAEQTESSLKRSDGPAGTDSLPFLAVGIPATSLASIDSTHGFGGLHSPADSIDRVRPDRLNEGAVILATLLTTLRETHFMV